MLKILSLAKDILELSRAIYKKVSMAFKKKKVKDAFEEKHDQRPIEDLVSSTTGLPSNDDYDGMHTRKAKKRN